MCAVYQRSLSMVIYGVIELKDNGELVAAGYAPGPFELLQQSGLDLGDERSDRSRVMWPHVFDVLHGRNPAPAPAEGPDTGGDRRWHLEAQRVEDIARAVDPRLVGVEVLRFLSDREVSSLRAIRGGSRSEVVSGLAVLYIEASAGDLEAFRSRREQDIHETVGDLLKPIGTIGRDRIGTDDFMHASELPFVISAAVDHDGRPDLEDVSGRDLEGAARVSEHGWDAAIWQDLLVLTAEHSGHVPYWPRHRCATVALAGVGDVMLVLVAQRYALQMLATRIGAADAGDALRLQAAAHPMRSRLWWSGLSGDPLVARVTDAVADRWDLADLSEETFTGLEALAQRGALAESTLLNQILAVFAVVSLLLATAAVILDLSGSTPWIGVPVAVAVAACLIALSQTKVGRETRRIFGRTG